MPESSNGFSDVTFHGLRGEAVEALEVSIINTPPILGASVRRPLFQARH